MSLSFLEQGCLHVDKSLLGSPYLYRIRWKYVFLLVARPQYKIA